MNLERVWKISFFWRLLKNHAGEESLSQSISISVRSSCLEVCYRISLIKDFGKLRGAPVADTFI